MRLRLLSALGTAALLAWAVIYTLFADTDNDEDDPI